MRYTTIIDISEQRDLYRNVNVRLVYLHLVLKSGYHDHDRDQVKISYRSLAADSGLTLSQVRHAINVLIKWHMLIRKDDSWIVRKWCSEQPITTRAKSSREAKKKAQEQAVSAERERQRAMDEEDKKRRDAEAGDRDNYIEFVRKQHQLAAAGDLDAIAWLNDHPASKGLAK